MRAEGALMARRQSILDVLRFRFDPPVSVYQQLERYLETITDEAQLEKLLAVAARWEVWPIFRPPCERSSGW